MMKLVCKSLVLIVKHVYLWRVDTCVVQVRSTTFLVAV